MEAYKTSLSFYAPTRLVWRYWLEYHHKDEEAVWLVIYHKDSAVPSLDYEEAVEEALCFGWIDSKPNKRDSESYYLYFAPRKLDSLWSRANRDRVERMLNAGKMTPPGLELVDHAKNIGTWEKLEEAQSGIIPKDLQVLFNKNRKAEANFLGFPPSSKRIILEWILGAKRQLTREKRLEETVRLAEKNIRANHYRP